MHSKYMSSRIFRLVYLDLGPNRAHCSFIVQCLFVMQEASCNSGMVTDLIANDVNDLAIDLQRFLR